MPNAKATTAFALVQAVVLFIGKLTLLYLLIFQHVLYELQVSGKKKYQSPKELTP